MIRLSTGLVNYLAGGGSLKKALCDGCIDVYSGTQPTDSDSASGALLLCRISYQGGAGSSAPTASTAKKDVLIIGGSGPYTSKIYAYTPGDGNTYTYTAVLADTLATIAKALAAKINASSVVSAYDDGVSQIVVVENIPGALVGDTSATSGSGTMSLTTVSSARGTGIQFGGVAVGALSKEAGAWQGTGLQAGLAGWGRFKANLSSGFDDDSTSTSFMRLDFAINTANSDMIALSSLNMVSGVTSTVDTCVLTIPKS